MRRTGPPLHFHLRPDDRATGADAETWRLTAFHAAGPEQETFALQQPVPPGIPVVIEPQSVTQSSTDLALMAGGGISLLAAAHVSIDVDFRYLRFMADQTTRRLDPTDSPRDRNIGRFGVGISYRF